MIGLAPYRCPIGQEHALPSAAASAAICAFGLRREIATIIDLTARATRSRLLKLVERGLVREIGTSPQDPKRRYFRTG